MRKNEHVYKLADQLLLENEWRRTSLHGRLLEVGRRLDAGLMHLPGEEPAVVQVAHAIQCPHCGGVVRLRVER